MRKRESGDAANVRIGTVEEACERYSFGRNKIREIAADAGAVIKLGRSVRINFTILDKYFDSLSGD